MRKRNKIKKKKSFMFTTKHHSFLGILGCVLCAVSFAVILLNINIAFINRGHISSAFAGISFFALAANVIGIISATVSLTERDIHKYVPITALLLNILNIAVWVLLILYGRA